MMTRNTSRRVEIACPILDEDIKSQLLHILEVMFADNVKARLLTSNGLYKKIEMETDEAFDSQQYFIEELIARNSTDSKPKMFLHKLMNSISRNR
jgi:polyphosphate kinase